MQVQGFAAALAMLDDHESSRPPDGVESVHEGTRYRKKKLGASGHATKDEKDEEQHTQRERESHKRVARHAHVLGCTRPRTARPAEAAVRSTATPSGGSPRREQARTGHLRHHASRHQRQGAQHGRASAMWSKFLGLPHKPKNV